MVWPRFAPKFITLWMFCECVNVELVIINDSFLLNIVHYPRLDWELLGWDFEERLLKMVKESGASSKKRNGASSETTTLSTKLSHDELLKQLKVTHLRVYDIRMLSILIVLLLQEEYIFVFVYCVGFEWHSGSNAVMVCVTAEERLSPVERSSHITKDTSAKFWISLKKSQYFYCF